MNLNIGIPNYCANEVEWILRVLFTEFLGVGYKLIECRDEEYFTLECDGKTLSITNAFFLNTNNRWLQPETLPVVPLELYDIGKSVLNNALVGECTSCPVLYGVADIRVNEDAVRIGIDIIGSAFFMLSRYEEVVVNARDKHGRFAATSSVAFQEKFLERPIINEYLEILWAAMKHLWPRLERKKRCFRKVITCDVDFPYDLAAKSLRKTIFRSGARILRDRNLKLAVRDFINYFSTMFGSSRFDSYYNNIKWIMDINEGQGNKVAFYFIPRVTSEKYDCNSNILSPEIRYLLREIFHRGHEIGIHPGYLTAMDEVEFSNSFKQFYNVLMEENISQPAIGGRQHYLRYDISITPGLWSNAGLDYDSTLGYADKAGFRCGVCYEYTMYDIEERKPLTVKQKPLIVMDTSIFSGEYEGMGYTEDALARFMYFKIIVKRFSGDFVLLWHNTGFISNAAKNIYKKVIA